MVALRAPRSRAPRILARSIAFRRDAAFPGEIGRVAPKRSSLPRGSTRDRARWSRFALRGHGLRGFSLVRSRSGATRHFLEELGVSHRNAPHSREAPPVTELDGRASRSAVTGSADSRSFDRVPARRGISWRNWACRTETLLTPERLHP